MRKLHQRGPLDQAIYIQTQIGRSRMRNLHQRNHSTEQFTLKYKQATQKCEIYAKDTNNHTRLTQTHNHKRFAKRNTQDSCKHARIQNITTHDSHKNKNKQTHKTHIKHQTNM